MMISGDYRAPTLRAKPGGSRLYCPGCRKMRVVERPWAGHPPRCTVCKSTIHGRS